MPDNSKKTIMIVVEEGFTARSLLYSGFLERICREFSKVVVFAPEEKISLYGKKFSFPNVIFEPIKTRKNTRAEKALYKIMKFSIHTRINQVKLLRTLRDENGRIIVSKWWAFFPFLYLSWVLSKKRRWRSFLRKLYKKIPDDPYCAKYIHRHNPDVVYANYSDVAVNDFNLKLFKAAKNRNIMTIGNIFSWDNLYSKVFITLHTDFLTVPTEMVKQEAVLLGDFDDKKIRVTGSPHFDYYFSNELKMKREDFFRSIGGDPKRKLILFTLGNRISEIDLPKFLSVLNQWIEKNEKTCQVYVRPYPKRPVSEDLKREFEVSDNIIFENKDEDIFASGKAFEFSEKDKQLLSNLMFHCDVVITMHSTVPIDACINNRPVVIINYSNDNKKRYKYWTVEIHERFEHIVQLLAYNAMKIANSDKDLITYLEQYLSDKKINEEERKKLSSDQLGKKPGHASENLFTYITEKLK